MSGAGGSTTLTALDATNGVQQFHVEKEVQIGPCCIRFFRSEPDWNIIGACFLTCLFE